MLEHATLQYVETKCLKCGAKITIPQVIDDEKYVEEMMTQTLKNYQQLMDEAKKDLGEGAKLADHTEILGAQYVCIERKKWLKWFGD